MLLRLDDIAWQMEPYKIGLCRPVFEASVYEDLVATWPATELFLKITNPSYRKLAMTERAPKNYYAFLETCKPWQAVYRCIKSQEWIDYAVRATGLPPGKYTSRFEFSLMPAAGGGIDPHTDIPSKVLTLIVPIMRVAEWDAAWGGGTDVLVPRDPGKVLMDYKVPLSEFEKAATYEYEPNQACVFLKSDRSWHSVGPIVGPADKWRRTLTINVEKAA